MNKLLRKILGVSLGFALATGVGVGAAIRNNRSFSKAEAAEATVTWTATAANNLGAKIESVGSTAAGTINTGSFSWSYTRTLVNLADGKADNISFQGSTWIQLGSSNSLESIVFETTEITGAIKSVSVTAATSGTHKLNISVGGNSYLSNESLTTYSSTASATNPDPTNCVETGTGSSSGKISISLASTATTTNKAVLIRSISVTYESNEPVYESIGNGSATTDSESRASITWSGLAGLTIAQIKGSSGTDVATGYNTASTVRLYVGHVFSFVADTANGYALLGVKFINSTNSSYYGGTYHASTTWSDITTNISTDDTTNLTLSGCSSTTSGSTSTIIAKDSTNGVGAIYVSTTKQSRPSAIEVSYLKPEATDPTSISCDAQSILVTETVSLKNQTVISPVGAVTDLSFAIKTGSDNIDLNTTTGVVTGKKGGTSVVTITPSNTAGGATAIDVSITITSIPSSGLTIGNDYILYAAYSSTNYALTGISSSIGTAASYSSEVPTSTFILNVENGYFENTIAFKNGSNYLSLNSNEAKLQTKTTIDVNSSWKVSYDSSDNSATIVNCAYPSRGILLNYNSGNPRFCCYGATSSTIVDVSLFPYSYKALEAIEITSSLSLQVHENRTIEVTYDPEDTTETTLSWKSDDEDVATVNNGVVTGVSEGTCTVTAWFDANSNGTLDSGEISDTCDVTVTEFTPTHSRVTSMSQLTNGSKVVFASNDEDYDLISAPHTGGNNLPSTEAAFDRTANTLEVESGYQEFTVWCVDTVRDAYVFSDGGYYLCVNGTENTQLKRTDVLTDSCQFFINDDTNGVTVTSAYYSLNGWGTYTVQLNASTKAFSVYKTEQKAATLYVNNDTADTVQGFVDVFMHMNSYSSNNGYCADENHHYYSDAKTAYATLTAQQKEDFCTKSAYADAYARLSAWAAANGETFDGSYSLVSAAKTGLTILGTNNGAIIAVIIVISAIGLTSVGSYFLLKKKKEN